MCFPSLFVARVTKAYLGSFFRGTAFPVRPLIHFVLLQIYFDNFSCTLLRPP